MSFFEDLGGAIKGIGGAVGNFIPGVGAISSAVGGILGSAGGSNGSGFQGQLAPIISPTTQFQSAHGYDQAQTGLTQQQAFLDALTRQNGLQNQSNIFGQQQDLANQFQGIANGTGPNPAMAQLANTTGQNVANQAALMAGQRGAGANAGLLARQAAMQGGNLQQQAVGQGAALQAQQQLAAMNALQAQQGMMGNLANTQVNQQAGALTGYNQFAQGEQQNLLNSIAQTNNANVSNYGNVSGANSKVAAVNAGTQGQLLQGGLSGAGTAITEHFNKPLAPAAPATPAAPQPMYNAGHQSEFAKGGMVGPQSFAAKHILNAKSGMLVPGQAKVSGDSLKNDTVPAMLSPGEIVIPRHVMQSGDPVGNSAKFVQAVLARGKL